MRFQYPVYSRSPFSIVPGLTLTADIQTVLAQPFRVAIVSAGDTQDLLSAFDLVIVVAFEPHTNTEVVAWIDQVAIKNCILVCSTTPMLSTHQSVYWSNLLYLHFRCNNNYEDSNSNSKTLLFDALLGTRKSHRDYVFAQLKQDQLLDQGIVTYRDLFTKNIENTQFNIDVQYPYVSPKLDPSWEIPSQSEYSLSRLVPWKIYQQTWYSVVCETIDDGYWFFFTEKSMKPMYAKRLFVVFGTQYYLKNLKSLGFETFSSVMDESYDNIIDRQQRHQTAYMSFKELLTHNPQTVTEKIQPILEHNHHRLIELRQELDSNLVSMVKQHTPTSAWL